MRLYTLKKVAIRAGLYEPIRALRIALNPQARKDIADGLFFYGQFIKFGDLCFDIGANVGAKTELFAALGARVIAAEPQLRQFEILQARVKKFGGNVVALPVAAGRTLGTRPLYFGDHDGKTSLLADWSNGDNGSIDIQVTTLDRLIESYGLPDFLKIDVEGYEVEVLNGLSQPVGCVSFEYHHDPAGLRRALECIELLARMGKMEFNLTSMEGHSLISNWLPTDQFAKCLPELVREHPFGDIIARLC